MSSYLKYLQAMYDERTMARKMAYLRYNFSKYLTGKPMVLEIGPGVGEFVSLLNDKGITDIDIADIDRDVLRYVEKNYTIRNAFLIREKADLGNKLRSYDLIFLMQVLEHVPKNELQFMLERLYSHLNKNGVILITVPNGGNPLSTVERYSDLTHELIFTENSLKELASSLNTSGFEVVVTGYRIPPDSPVNIIRIGMQKILHLLLKSLLMINGGVYFNVYHPNITLVIRKT